MILEKVQQIYQDNLKKAFGEEERKAMTYLKSRGFSDETIQEFGVGYSNGNIKTELKDFQSLLSQQGILNARYNERNYQRLMFPLHNELGEIIGFNGRTLKEKSSDDKIYVKYLLSPESLEFSKSKTLFNLHRAKNYIKDQGSVYIVEGVMDCMTLWELGKRNVVCTLGTSLSKDHIQLLKKYTDKFIICYDNDIAGFSASVRNGRFISQAMREFLNNKSSETWSATKQILFTKLPINHDPNDLYLKDKSSLNSRLEQPLHYIDYCRQMCIENPSYQKVFEETLQSEKRLMDKNFSKGDIIKLKSDLRHTTDILEVAEDLGITVQKNGRNYVGICPFHDENTPSFFISQEKQIYKCFGCGKGGDVISLVSEIKKISYRESMQYLKQNYVIPYQKANQRIVATEKER
ncbi:CHC2 zinc finger domain-containing protein [uncultured Clostridium sp.]|uniref:CHC2 zinc finger domain-containing protein n=1 Tax=uncultured Clostridium sp. TaxID=59620 RepID=UPI002616258E|nr:CHC2 zinc finger domain-containing protein [uncultured Clostridium sp.]